MEHADTRISTAAVELSYEYLDLMPTPGQENQHTLDPVALTLMPPSTMPRLTPQQALDVGSMLPHHGTTEMGRRLQFQTMVAIGTPVETILPGI